MNELRAKVFADINSKQEKVSDVQLLALYYQIKGLTQEATAVMDVISALNTDPDSPIKGRVKTFDDDKGTWVKNSSLKQWLSPHLTSGGSLHGKTTAEQAAIIKAYIEGIARLWPEEWGNFKEYNLCRPTGFEIIFSFFEAAKIRCDLNCGKQYTVDNFAAQLKPVLAMKINIAGLGDTELDWQRGKLALMSNRATRELIGKQVRDCLRAADDE